MKDLQQKFHEIREVNLKLTESMADSREEVRNLTLAMKNLELQNIQQRKWMEDTIRKMAREMKILENKMVGVKATRSDEETYTRRVQSAAKPGLIRIRPTSRSFPDTTGKYVTYPINDRCSKPLSKNEPLWTCTTRFWAN